MSKKLSLRTGRYLLCATLILILSAGANCFAMGLMGPPTASLESGKFELGGEYAYSAADLKAKNGSWTELLDGAFSARGNADSFTLKNFKTSTGYARLGYGISDNVDVFVRIGTSKAKFGDSVWENSEKFHTDFDSAFGIGLKITVMEQDNLKLGGTILADTAQYDGQLYASHWASRDFVKLNMTQFKIALGGTYAFSDVFSLYGGPFLHFVNGDLTDELTEVDTVTGGLLRSKYTWDIREKDVVGGYIGAQIEMADNSAVAIEFEHTASADVIGASINWRF